MCEQPERYLQPVHVRTIESETNERENRINGAKDRPPSLGIAPLCIFRLSGMSKSRFFNATTKILGIMIIDIRDEIAKANRINRYII